MPSHAEWVEIERADALGDRSRRDIAAQYGITEGAIRKRLGPRTGTHGYAKVRSTQPTAPLVRTGAIREAAEKIAEANAAMEGFNIVERSHAYAIADTLLEISRSMAEAAKHGARTAERLHRIAAKTAEKVKEDDPIDSMQELQTVHALIKVGNDASQLSATLINLNKQQALPQDNKDPEGPVDADEFRRIARDVAADV